MDTAELLVVAMLAASSLPAFVLAFLIGVHGKTGLISGHTRGTARDERGLARWVGGWLAGMGLCMLVFAALHAPMAAAGLHVAWVGIFVTVIVVGPVAMAVGLGRYR